jgi:hypothetical protein
MKGAKTPRASRRARPPASTGEHAPQPPVTGYGRDQEWLDSQALEAATEAVEAWEAWRASQSIRVAEAFYSAMAHLAFAVQRRDAK